MTVGKTTFAALVLFGFASGCARLEPEASPGDPGAEVAADASEGAVEASDPGPEFDPGPELPSPELWPAGEDAASMLSSAGFSRFWTHVSGPVAERPDVGHRGSFGTGNGRVFGFVGLADPVNTVHTLVGPTYDKKEERFFGDWALHLGTATDAFDEEWVGRLAEGPEIVTAGRRGSLWLGTTDLVPPIGQAADRCWVRKVVVMNQGAAPVESNRVTLVPARSVTSPEPGVLVETAGPRTLRTQFGGGLGTVDGNTLVVDVGPLAMGAMATVYLYHCVADAADAPAAPPADPKAAFDAADAAAKQAFAAWDAGLVQFDLPDPMVTDFLNGMKLTLKVQTAASGASCPMSEYTRTWARDNIGPVTAMLDLGGFDDVRAMLDYLYAAIRYKGDLQNSYDSDLDPAAAPDAPDWASLPGLAGRVGAETPSYLVRMYGLYDRFAGDGARVTERWGLLRRCLMAQAFGVDHLLPFTGDETYREAMNAALGLGVNYAHDQLSWSANSSLLWLGAEREFERLAARVGQPGDAAAAAALRPDVEKGALDHYLLADGCVSPYADKATMTAAPAPFEDVALQVTWSGWKDGDDALAQSTLDCLLKRLRVAPGMIQSATSPDYALYGMIGDRYGMYTGMLPGYTLAALTDAGHPEARDAFNAVRLSLDTSGNLQEDMLYGDHSGLSLVYDPLGGVGDYTAKFRPWEGGIVLDAVFKYLTGFRPDAAGHALSLRPHLPNDWPVAGYRNLRVGDDRFDLAVERVAAGGVRVTVVSHAAAAYTVDLRWDAPAGAPPTFRVGDTPVPDDQVTRFEHFGAVSARTPAVPLAAGATVVFTVP